MKGYNSHGVMTGLSEILLLEEDRCNHTEEIRTFLKENGDTPAIWVCYDPITCYRMYAHDSEGYLIGNLSEAEIRKNYPNYMDDIVEINLTGMELVCSDQNDGFLYAEEKPNKTNSR